MKSIKTKIELVLIACILVTSFAVGSAGILSASKVVEQETVEIMELECKDKAQEISSLLKCIEQSVQTASSYAVEQLDDLERFQSDEAYVIAYTDMMESVILNAAEHTEGAMAVYLRYNPAFTEPTSGLFLTLEEEGYKKEIPTDFSKYETSDIEHVGWYYEPVSNGKPTWMPPYWNENIQVEMISYIIPIIIDGTTVGVIGMDINFKVLSDVVDGTTIFESGYGFLMDNQSRIVCHPSYMLNTPMLSLDEGIQNLVTRIKKQNSEEGLIDYSFKGESRKAVYEMLDNGMNFVVTAPTREIMKSRTDLIIQIIFITAIIGVLTLFVGYLVAAKIAKPLLELNEAAKKIADGDLNVTIVHHSKDEVGVLADSFRKTAGRLSEYINYINGLAYRDSMTGVKSKTAYSEAVEKIEADIRIKRPEFAVVICDLNGLKSINDRFGHDMGDMQIIAASKIICKVFKHSPVYRIGGDEFAVILTGEDLNDNRGLLIKFGEEMKAHNQHIKKELHVTIARGIAVYEAELDLTYQDVFKRADTAMYQNKESYKKTQEGML